ncbi:Asx homology domain-containing protein [Blakeslea trispora]|nr:Asx homology domain-containing protein [Blakeslea trispora]
MTIDLTLDAPVEENTEKKHSTQHDIFEFSMDAPIPKKVETRGRKKKKVEPKIAPEPIAITEPEITPEPETTIKPKKKETRGRKRKLTSTPTPSTPSIPPPIQKPKRTAVVSQEPKKRETRGRKKKEIKEEPKDNLNFLLTDKSSHLATADLRSLIPKWIDALDLDERQELAQLLPSSDTLTDDINPASFSLSNNFFWESVDRWQEDLAVGRFDKQVLAKAKAKQQAEEDTSFKDENYEAYWGERLKRDKALKADQIKTG